MTRAHTKPDCQRRDGDGIGKLFFHVTLGFLDPAVQMIFLEVENGIRRLNFSGFLEKCFGADCGQLFVAKFFDQKKAEIQKGCCCT